MSLPVVYRSKVGRDLANAFNYYEGQAEGLGEQFLATINSTFDAIERYPQADARASAVAYQPQSAARAAGCGR